MKNKLAVFAALCAVFALIAASSQVIEAARFGLRLCAELIIPSLFPFFVLSALLNRLSLPQMIGKQLSAGASWLFGVSGAGATALFVGLTGGYPLGAVYIAGMAERGSISEQEGERLLAFCNNSGPAFIIGAVGAGIFHSAYIGLLLYGAHIAAAVLTGLLLRKGSAACFFRGEVLSSEPETLSAALPAAVRDAVSAILNVCGFAVCFTAFSALLNANGQLSLLAGSLSDFFGMPLKWTHVLLTGIIELSSGVGGMQGFDASPLNVTLAAFLIGWGGVSVHFQTMAAIADTKITGTLHTAGRLLSAVLGSALAYFASLIFL